MSTRVSAILLAAALVPLTAPAALSGASDARVDAFRATCVPDRQDFEAILVRASADGWKVVTGEADPELKAVLDAFADPAAGAGSSIRSFRKEIDGRRRSSSPRA
jgi:hypothetical protein